MTFYIQASNPMIRDGVSANVTEIEEAVQDIFESETEDFLIVWGGVPIVLNYKFDMSVMIEDIIWMLAAIQADDSAQFAIEWPSNSFDTTWNLRRKGGTVTCEACWRRISGGVEILLKEVPSITMSIEQFLAEWKAPLIRVAEALEEVGYQPQKDDWLRSLVAMIDNIDGVGRLYVAAT